MKIHIHDKEFKTKPKVNEIKIVSNTILDNSVDVTLEEFAREHTEKGKTAVLCELDSNKLTKSAPIKSQKLIMLDFDNKDPNNLYTIDDLEQDTFMLENACFFYRTFSDSKSNVDKFRVVFELEDYVYSNEEVEKIYQELFKKYPQSDTSVGQTSRMFFGSNSGYEVIDWDNRLKLNLTNLPKEFIKSEVMDESIPNYELIRNKNYELVRKKLEYMSENIVLADEASAFRYLKTLNMREILELPEDNPFIDILEGEENPSASVYQSDDGTYLYKLFNKGGKIPPKDIIGLFSAITGESWFKSIQILIYIIGGEINPNSEIALIKRKTESFISFITDNDFKNIAPSLYSWIGRYVPEITTLLNIMMLYYRQNDKGEIKYINYLGTKKLRIEMESRLGYPISESKIKTVINVLSTIDGIWKLSDDEIPSDLLKTLKSVKKSNQNRNNVYELREYPENVVENMEDIAFELKRNNVTVRGLSFELLYRIFDEEKAKQVFPQNRLIGEYKDTKDEINLSNKSLKIEQLAIKYIMKEIKRKGFVFEASIIRYLYKQGFPDAEYKYKQMIGDIINKYNLNRARLSKSLKEELNINNVKSTKTIIY